MWVDSTSEISTYEFDQIKSITLMEKKYRTESQINDDIMVREVLSQVTGCVGEEGNGFTLKRNISICSLSRQTVSHTQLSGLTLAAPFLTSAGTDPELRGQKKTRIRVEERSTAYLRNDG